jgi:hypothetical protein
MLDTSVSKYPAFKHLFNRIYLNTFAIFQGNSISLLKKFENLEAIRGKKSIMPPFPVRFWFV